MQLPCQAGAHSLRPAKFYCEHEALMKPSVRLHCFWPPARSDLERSGRPCKRAAGRLGERDSRGAARAQVESGRSVGRH